MSGTTIIGYRAGQAPADVGPYARHDQHVASGRCDARCRGPAEPDDEAPQRRESQPVHRREGNPPHDRIEDVPESELVPEVPASPPNPRASERPVGRLGIGAPVPVLKGGGEQSENDCIRREDRQCDGAPALHEDCRRSARQGTRLLDQRQSRHLPHDRRSNGPRTQQRPARPGCRGRAGGSAHVAKRGRPRHPIRARAPPDRSTCARP